MSAPTRLLSILIFLLAASIICAAPDTGIDEPSPTCDQTKFFLCASDNSCIPRAWLADGEPDCADATDESDEIYEALQKTRPPPHGTPTTSKVKQSAVMVDRNLSDDTDLFATTTTSTSKGIAASIASANASSEASGGAGATVTHCTPEQSAEAAKCAADVLAWLDELENGLSVVSPSIFRNETALSHIERGCALLPAYLSCVDALPAACERSAQAARLVDWLSVQTYLCELLAPSLREHYACFSGNTKPNNFCSTRRVFSTGSRLVCAIVGTAADDIDCVERVADTDSNCDERARELFTPLRSETMNALEDLKCPTSPSTTLQSTTVPTSFRESVATENEIQAQSDARQVQPSVRKVARKPATATTETTPTNAPPAAIALPSAANLTSAMHALANLDAVCAVHSSGVDLWAPIRAKLCARRDTFVKHTDCYAQVLRQTERKCLPQLTRETTCGAIDAFNHNIDCVISTLTKMCASDAQEQLVDVQERLNDEAIAHKCYHADSTAASNAPISSDGFVLTPKMPRCNEAQENMAVTCLVDLIEINRQLPQFASLNFLAELSDANSTLVNRICELYERYHNCLRVNVFHNATKTCAFNSPLNTLARIGLSPICTPITRQLIINSRTCLQDVGRQISAEHCQSGLQRLAGTVEMMLHGIHGEALLCKSFYVMRASFECGESVIHEKCDTNAYENIQKVKQKMSEIGLEEGCPAEEPADLDAIIARPVAASQPPAAPITNLPPPPSVSSTLPSASPPPCDPEAQKRFNECIRPLVAFQPHPLAVIKTPKDIDAACHAFDTFKQCRNTVDCNPVWASGMSAMFEYSCGDGAELYAKVKTCVRRVTTRTDIRDCVTVFSKSPPHEACHSANQLMACSLPLLGEKCGDEAVAFVREYIRRFTQTVDTDCQLPTTFQALHTSPVKVFNCSAAEVETAQQCARPLADIHVELERLFKGGFQAFLKNVNNIAPIFARGCNLTNEFRQCAKPVLERAERNVTNCVLSSCFIRAGDGICDQPNVAEAIDSNLQCVFKQVAVPEFGKCMRSTIATLRQFTLEALRGVLPRFVDCVEPIVMRACGSTPLNVLRAFGSLNICPVHSATSSSLTVVPTSAVEECTPELAREFDGCMRPFTVKYNFVPVALLNRANETTLCSDLDAVTQCIEKNRVCDKPGKSKALRKLITQICSNKHAFDQRAECLGKVVASSKGIECLASYSEVAMPDARADEALCTALNATTECMAERVFEDCPPDSVPFVYDYSNAYWRDMAGDSGTACELTAPTVTLHTGCPEEEFVNYLKCESFIDKYHFQPISIIRDPSMWEKFCTTVEADYRPCLENLACKFEPTMSATLSLFQTTCDSSSALGKMQASIAGCLGEFTKSKEGEECLKPFIGFDLLGRDSNERICSVINELLRCAAPSLNKNCGADAVAHVYGLHELWTRGYNESCALQRPTSNELSTTVAPTEATTTPRSTSTVNRMHAQPSKRVETTTIRATESSTQIQTTVEATTEAKMITSEATSTISEIVQKATEEAVQAITETTRIIEKTTEAKTIANTETIATSSQATTLANPKLQHRTASGNGAVRGAFSRLFTAASLILIILFVYF